MSQENEELRNELEQLLHDNPDTGEPGSVAEAATGNDLSPDEIAKNAEKLLQDVAMEVEEESNIQSFPDQTTSRSGTMSLDMTGDISLDLRLNFDGQSVYISCDRENLLLQLKDGTSFRLPLVGSDAGKKLAA